MTKVLFLSDTKFEDEHAANYRQNLCGGLVDAGHSAEILFKRPLYFLKAISAARKADLLFISNFPSVNHAGFLLARLFNKKLIVNVLGDYAWETAVKKGKTSLLIDDFQKSAKTGRIGVLHRLQARVCKKADLVIVPSEYLAKLVTGWGVDREKIKVVHGAVDFSMPEISREEARKKIGIPGSIILSAGRLVPWKGFKMLIKMMPQILEINQFLRLVIIGDGPEYKILRAMIKNLGLEKKIYLVGKKNKEELGLFMVAADIFVLNTGHEGFSHQVLETMSAGVPIITTAVGGNLEVVRQGENGFLVKYNDEFNLLEAIKTLWQNQELREQFIEEGKKTARHFSSEKMVNETIKTISSFS